MTTKVEKTLLVDVPVRVAYNQWTQFEDFPKFMGGVQEVRQVDDSRLHWVTKIAGVKREWDATILEQVPDKKIAWAATEGVTNAGAVYFSENGAAQTTVTLSLEYEPEGIVAKVGDKLALVEKQVEGDLRRFKDLVEGRGYETGGWRGTLNKGGAGKTPGVDAAASSRGDKGVAGWSGMAKTFGAAAVAAGAAAATAFKSSYDQSKTKEQQDEEVIDLDEAVVVQGTPEVPPEAAPVTPDTEPLADDELTDDQRRRL